MKLKRKIIYSFLITVIIMAVICMVSCANNEETNLQQTRPIDQSGNIITNAMIQTNTLYFIDDIPS